MELHKKHTDSGIEIQQVYTPLDLPDTANTIPDPGTYPYTRGVQKDMYRGKLWTMRQYAGFSTAQESNKRYHYLLSQGVMGLSVAFDLPTQIGYDADHALADGEVGKVGVSICSIEDMEILFDGIPLDKISTSMTINATSFILLALYVAALIYILQDIPCVSLQIFLNGVVPIYQNGIASLFLVTIFVKQEVPQFRKLHLH